MFGCIWCTFASLQCLMQLLKVVVVNQLKLHCALHVLWLEQSYLLVLFSAKLYMPASRQLWQRIRGVNAAIRFVHTECAALRYRASPRVTATKRIATREMWTNHNTKAPSIPATLSKQHCRSNRQLCCLLLRQCCRFGQQCRSNVRLCRKDEISTQNSFDIVAVFGNKVERCFDIVAKNGNNVEATFDIVAFDNVASTLLLVWTGLNAGIVFMNVHPYVECCNFLATFILCEHSSLYMAAGGNAIIFYRCNLVFFYFVSVDKRPAMGSQPNLTSRSEVVSIYKCPKKFRGGPPNLWRKKHQILDHFFTTPALETTYLRNEMSHRQTKMLVSIYHVSPKSWFTFRDLWPRSGWDPFCHCKPAFGGHYVATIKVATSLVKCTCIFHIITKILLLPLTEV